VGENSFAIKGEFSIAVDMAHATLFKPAIIEAIKTEKPRILAPQLSRL